MKRNVLMLMGIAVAAGLAVLFWPRRNPIADKINALMGKEVVIPIEQLHPVHPNGATIDSSYTADAAYKIVVFFDSISCSSCAYNSMYQWNDFIDEANEGADRVRFYFIMNPSEKNKAELYRATRIPNGLDHPLLLDTLGVFAAANDFLPAERMFHYMLLNSDNQILLVGDPTANQRLRELYLKTIKE